MLHNRATARYCDACGHPISTPSATILRGVARNVRYDHQAASAGPAWWRDHTLTFDLEQQGVTADPRKSIPVELRARIFDGAIREGNRLEVPGPWREGTTLRPPRVRNLSTGTLVQAVDLTALPAAVGLLILLLLFNFGSTIKMAPQLSMKQSGDIILLHGSNFQANEPIKVKIERMNGPSQIQWGRLDGYACFSTKSPCLWSTKANQKGIYEGSFNMSGVRAPVSFRISLVSLNNGETKTVTVEKR